MRIKRFLLVQVILLLLLVAAGCNSVLSKHVIGDVDEDVNKDKIEGTLLGPGGSFFQSKFKKDGKTLVLAGVEWSEEDQRFEVNQFEVVFSKGKERHFANAIGMEGNDDGGEIEYNLAEYDFLDDGYIAVWLPDFDAFRAHIQSGALRGEVRSSDTVFLEDDSQKLLEFIEHEGNEHLFRYREPLILKKMRP